MKKIVRLLLLVLCVGGCSASISAQDSQLSETQDKYTKADVYVYRAPQPRASKPGGPSPLYANETLLATLDSGKYVHVRLDPGFYNFGTKGRKGERAGIELKRGETYYLRIELDGQAGDRDPRVTTIPKDKGAIEVRQMSPITGGDIKNRALVVDDNAPAEPAEARP